MLSWCFSSVSREEEEFRMIIPISSEGYLAGQIHIFQQDLGGEEGQFAQVIHFEEFRVLDIELPVSGFQEFRRILDDF